MKRAFTGPLLVTIAAAIAVALALSSAPPLAVTTAEFSDREVMSNNLFTAFGPGPAGLSLEPGKSKATWVSNKHAPFSPIAAPADGSLHLDFGEVTFQNDNMSPDVFRICNRSSEVRDFEVIISPALQDLFRDVEIEGGGRIAPGINASVRIGINGGARPPGSYSGTLVVRDLTDEFYRILRVTVRILGTIEAKDMEKAGETASVGGEPERTVGASETPAPPTVEAPDGAPAEPAATPEAAPESAPEPAPDTRPEPDADDPSVVPDASSVPVVGNSGEGDPND